MFEISGFIENFKYLGIFVLLILGGIGLPFPEDATLIICGFLLSHDIIKLIPALIVIYIGLLISDSFLYFIGRKYGRSIVMHKKFQKILTPERLSALEVKFNKKGSLIILFGRHLAGLRAQLFIVAGTMKMSASKFLISDGISSLFTMALWGGVGYLGGNSLQIIKNDITRIEHVAIFIFTFLLTIYLLVKYFRSKRINL